MQTSQILWFRFLSKLYLERNFLNPRSTNLTILSSFSLKNDILPKKSPRLKNLLFLIWNILKNFWNFSYRNKKKWYKIYLGIIQRFFTFFLHNSLIWKIINFIVRDQNKLFIWIRRHFLSFILRLLFQKITNKKKSIPKNYLVLQISIWMTYWYYICMQAPVI